MILWQKHASASWLATNESRLEKVAGASLAITSRPGRARILVQVTCPRRARAERLRRNFGGTVEPLPGDWLKSPEPHPPIRVGRRLEVVSAASPATPADAIQQLVIPAAGAFGTGEHSTTAMSLRLLEETTRKWRGGWRLLDAGTGTGILALAARRLGAANVLGLDNDRCAIAHARQNARLNHIARTRFEIADVLRWKSSAHYEVVTANLFSELLIAALPVFRRALPTGGWLIASGILREQAEAVIRSLPAARFALENQRRRGRWVALRGLASS